MVFFTLSDSFETTATWQVNERWRWFASYSLFEVNAEGDDARTIGLIEGARALAFMRGRGYALPEDMTGLVGDVMRHRLVLSYEALAEGLNADALIERVLKKIPVPDKPLAAPA